MSTGVNVSMNRPAVAVIGQSHLGLITAIGLASKGFPVTAFDTDAALIAKLKNADLPVSEPNLPELLSSAKSSIAFTDVRAQLRECDVLYIAKDVPTSSSNVSDTSVISALLEEILPVVKDGATVVIHSQVSPGFSRSMLQLVKDQGRSIQLYYQVETLVFGLAVQRVLEPERYIVGCEEPNKPLPQAYEAVLTAFGCPLFLMRYESAELAKIAINMFLVSSVITASTLAEVSEEIGADWSEIIPTLRLDKRIGPHAYLSPGLGIAGGNLERDLVSVQTMAQRCGTDAGIVSAWLTHSKYRSRWVLRQLSRHVFSKNESATIAIWGLAYKQDTHSIKNSAGVALLNTLRQSSVRAFDPRVTLAMAANTVATQARDALDACRGADALAVMTPWSDFVKIDPADVAAAMNGRDIFDPYQLLDAKKYRALGFSVYCLGRKDT
jgi:UDPglucose 6-dehydrogenase